MDNLQWDKFLDDWALFMFIMAFTRFGDMEEFERIKEQFQSLDKYRPDKNDSGEDNKGGQK